MISLSGPCELLFSLDLSYGECNVISLYFLCCSINGSVCLVCCVFVNCLVKQFAIFMGVVLILLLNIMEVLSVGGGALLDRPCMVFQRMCVLHVCCEYIIYIYIYIFKLMLYGCVVSVCCVGFAPIDVVCDELGCGSYFVVEYYGGIECCLCCM